ncbi:MAG: hypothetical protein KKB91_01965 [Proteobacteria bacterium]|jgi:hypothetical protein|nr:hypothetical protein [Desulfocapsa sp.]MBU3944093.1 hypothetical protein [Pseudomonadota bacterium]MCG2743978.1 hypothetical protein [Desulfobacteraceae bacterium]MBU4029766.1 hypothetical protein [Pseudomonadota bacterium]MBU4043416.1 hypothetical protein [Pseudomonadota bacterium]
MYAEGTPPAITAFVPPSPQAIIDVEKSFRNAIARYTLLEQAAFSLTADIPTLSPQQILLRSRQLAKMQQDMVSQDDQLIAIMNLAGQEIVNTHFVKGYQHILAKVMLSCDQVWEQTLLVKKKLLNESTIHRNLDSSCQD